jgi:hypothetical protein
VTKEELTAGIAPNARRAIPTNGQWKRYGQGSERCRTAIKTSTSHASRRFGINQGAAARGTTTAGAAYGFRDAKCAPRLVTRSSCPAAPALLCALSRPVVFNPDYSDVIIVGVQVIAAACDAKKVASSLKAPLWRVFLWLIA